MQQPLGHPSTRRSPEERTSRVIAPRLRLAEGPVRNRTEARLARERGWLRAAPVAAQAGGEFFRDDVEVGRSRSTSW